MPEILITVERFATTTEQPVSVEVRRSTGFGNPAILLHGTKIFSVGQSSATTVANLASGDYDVAIKVSGLPVYSGRARVPSGTFATPLDLVDLLTIYSPTSGASAEVSSTPFSLARTVVASSDFWNEFAERYPGGGDSGTSLRYSATFTNSSLTVAGLLVVVHNFGVFPTAVRIVSSVGEEMYAPIVDQSTSAVAIDLSAFRPLDGTWRILIGG